MRMACVTERLLTIPVRCNRSKTYSGHTDLSSEQCVKIRALYSCVTKRHR